MKIMIKMIWEEFIKLFQSCMVTVYLVRCLGAKLERSKAYVTGIIVTFMYLVIQSLMTDFVGAGSFVGLMVSKDFLRIVGDKDASYYVTTVLAQVFLAVFITIIVKMEARTKTFLKIDLSFSRWQSLF